MPYHSEFEFFNTDFHSCISQALMIPHSFHTGASEQNKKWEMSHLKEEELKEVNEIREEQQAPVLEMKPLSIHLKYAFLGE